MGELLRDHIPETAAYLDGLGVILIGRGKWRGGECRLHGGSDSFRVNTESNGWCCMSCGAKGGDALALHMAITGQDFERAARDLGAYRDDGKPHRASAKPAALTAREAMELSAFELLVAQVVISDIRAGLIPSDVDWERFLLSAGRVGALAEEYRA